MADASVAIFEPVSSPTTRHAYLIRLTGSDGRPVEGEDISVTLEGDGSLAPNFSAKDTRRETDADGRTSITWYRRAIFTRDVKATLSASHANTDYSISLELSEPEVAAPIGYVERPIRIRPS